MDRVVEDGVITELVVPEDAARELVVTPGTLAAWRSRGRGPAFVKVGSLVRYMRCDLQAFVADARREPAQ